MHTCISTHNRNSENGYIIKLPKPYYLSQFALSEGCVQLLLIEGPDTFFKLRKNKINLHMGEVKPPYIHKYL